MVDQQSVLDSSPPCSRNDVAGLPLLLFVFCFFVGRLEETEEEEEEEEEEVKVGGW
jgi:hypothetical protein